MGIQLVLEAINLTFMFGEDVLDKNLMSPFTVVIRPLWAPPGVAVKLEGDWETSVSAFPHTRT